jgi:hypothetical protein
MARATPKFGDWDASNPTFTTAFRMMRANKSTRQGFINLNDPEALAEYLTWTSNDGGNEAEEASSRREDGIGAGSLPKPPAWRHLASSCKALKKPTMRKQFLRNSVSSSDLVKIMRHQLVLSSFL